MLYPVSIVLLVICIVTGIGFIWASVGGNESEE